MALKINNIFIPKKEKIQTSPAVEAFQYEEEKVNVASAPVKPNNIENSILTELERESNQNYDKVVANIVRISGLHLNHQNDKKTGIRGKLIWFFIVLLSFQMISVVVLIVLSAKESWGFVISDFLLATFITSVFVETLGAMIIMVSFAFGSKEEVQVIGLLTEVIKNYQKYVRDRYQHQEQIEQINE